MSEPAGSESPLRIAALHQQAAASVNVMRPGNGTPWEDRGRVGMAAGFGRTLIAGLVSPVRLLESIRRLDTMADAVPLVIIYGLFWAVSVIVHAAIVLHGYQSDHTLEVNTTAFWQGAGILAALVAVGFIVVMRIAALTLERLTALDIKQRLPRPMYFNLIAYCLAPSLVAPLPMVGPVLAGVWIVALWAVAARKRLHAAWAASIIGAVVTGALVLVIGVGVYLGGGFVYSMVMGDSATKIVAPTHSRQ